MTADSRKDLLKRYRDRVAQSAKWRKQDGYDKSWKKFTDLYRGKHFLNVDCEEDRIAVNLVFATINVVAPSVSVNDPKLVVYSQKNEDGVKAVIVETILNYWWRHFNFQEEFALAVKDDLILGHGWLKVGWRYVEELKSVGAQPIAADTSDDEDDSKDLTPEDPTEKPANEVDDEEIDADPEYEATQDRPFVERVSPYDIYVDPEAKTLAAAKWIAQRMVKSLAEVKQDKRYRLKGRQCLEPDAQSLPDWRNDDHSTDDIKRCTLWEFYDMTLGTMCVFSDMGEELLLDPIPQPYSFGHPFVMLRNYEVPDHFYPMGDVEALEPLQLELDKTRSQMMNHRKRYDRKWLYRQEAFDPQGLAALQLDQDMVMVPVADANEPLADMITPVPITSVDPQMYQYLAGIEADIDKVSGVAEFQQGQSSNNISHSATEASMIADAANSRAQDKLRTIEISIGAVARRVIALAQQYLTQDQEARVLGNDGYPVWIPFGREEVQGEFDFEVEAGSTKPMNESQRRSQALQMLQTFTPYASAGLVNAQELIKYALTYGFGVKNPERFMMAQQPSQPGEAAKSPKQSIVETMNYQNMPPDIQRQMEAAAGFTPSTVGGSSPAEMNMSKAVAPQLQAQAQAPQQAQQLQATQQQAGAQQQHEANQQSAKHAHDASMAAEARKHDHAKQDHTALNSVQQAQMGHQQAIEQGAQQHQQATQQGDQQAGNNMLQQMMAQANQPEPGGQQGPGPGGPQGGPPSGPGGPPGAGTPDDQPDTTATFE